MFACEGASRLAGLKSFLFGRHAAGFALALAVLVAAPAPADAQRQSGTLSFDELIPKLREGGYVLYVRHAATDHSQEDRDLSDLSNCALQRNLSDQGKQEARALGEALARLDIKIGEVRTSPYCRCADTARIAFGRFEIDNNLRAAFFTDEEETEQLSAHLRRQLSTKPEPGTNTVLVGHTANLRDVTDVWPKPEGVVHIFKPLGEGQGYEHLGRIVPSKWLEIVNQS